MKLGAVLTIARKDLLDALRNARLLVVVLMPIGFSLLYGYLFRDTPSGLEVVIYSAEPSALVEQLALVDSISLHVVDSEAALVETMERENAQLGVVLPPGFDLELQSGLSPQLSFFSAEASSEQSIARQLVLATIEALSGRQPLVAIVEERFGEPAAPDANQTENQGAAEFLIGLDLQGYFIVLWVMMGVSMNGALLVPTLIVEEKEQRTLDSILVTPASYREVVIGKLLVGLVYSLLSAMTILLLNGGLRGDLGLSLAFILLTSLAVSLIGLLVGGLVENMTTLNTWGGFIILPLMLPGILGALPLGEWSPWISVTMQTIPTYQLVRGLGASLSGRGLETAPGLLLLAGEIAVLFLAVIWSLRRRER